MMVKRSVTLCENSMNLPKLHGKNVVVIGAGMAGLICAQKLQHQGINVTVLEKSAGVGGRMATRRLQGNWADHGAQYLSAHGEAFERFIHKLQNLGIVTEWTNNIHQLTPEGLQPPDPAMIYPRYTCPQGMTAIAKYLAQDLEQVLLDTRIIAVEVQGQQWLLTTETQNQFVADAIVSTLPAPQFLALFQDLPAPEFVKAIQSVKFNPNITIMAGYAVSPELLPSWQAVRCMDDSILSWVSFDSTKHPHQAAQPVFVLQSTAEFARQSLEEGDLQKVGTPMLQRAGEFLDPWLRDPEWWQVHRWRYALVDEILGVDCLVTTVPLPLVCAGDWCAGKNVEGAYTSGLAAATSMSDLLS